MNNYYFIERTDSTSNHQILHRYGCQQLPNHQSREYLGYFGSLDCAENKAKEEGFMLVQQCPNCCQ